MATTGTSQPTASHTRWKWFLLVGGLLLILGATGVGAALLQVSSLLIFGPLLLISSLIQVGAAFFAVERKESVLHFIAAGVEAILGLLIMANPFEQVISVVGLVAIFLLVFGLVRLARSVAAHSRGRTWTIVTGVIALLLGIALWIVWPDRKLWLVGLFIAIDFICHGTAWSVRGWLEKQPQHATIA